MARQTSLQELLSQPGKGASSRPRRAKAQAPPKNYDEDRALRWAIEESLKEANPAETDIGGTHIPTEADQPSRDIAELESRPWQPVIAQGSRGQSNQEAPESDDEGSLDLRRSSIGRERSRSVQPISMTTTAASCLFNAPSPRRRSALFGTPQPKELAMEVMSSDPEEEELGDLELIRAPTTSGLSSATGGRVLSSKFSRSTGLHRRPKSTLSSSQCPKTHLATSSKSSTRETIDISVLSSDDGDHLAGDDASNDADELSRDLSLDVFTTKATSRKSGYPTAQDIVAVRPSPSPEILDLEEEAGTASIPWTLSAEKDIVLDTPQKQRTRMYEMILDSEDERSSDDGILVTQKPWPLSGRHVDVRAKHTELPRIPDTGSSGRRSIVVLASDTEDEPEHQERLRSQRSSPRVFSPRSSDSRQSSVMILGSRDPARPFRLSKPRPLRLYQSQTDTADHSDVYRSEYQSQEEVVGGSLEFSVPSSLEESDSGSQDRVRSPTPTTNNEENKQPCRPEDIPFSEDSHTTTRHSLASQSPSSPKDTHRSLKGKALQMKVDDFVIYPQHTDQRVVTTRREDSAGDATFDHKKQFSTIPQSSGTSSSHSAPQPLQKWVLNAGQKHHHGDPDGDSGYKAQEEKEKKVADDEEEEKEERLEDPRLRRSSLPSPAKRTRINPPKTRFLIPKEPPRAFSSTLHARSDLMREDTIESFSSLSQSQQLSFTSGSFGRGMAKLAEDEIEPFSDDEATSQAHSNVHRSDQDHGKKSRRYSALHFDDRPAALVHGWTTTPGQGGGSSEGTPAAAAAAVAVGRREPCPLCGKLIPIAELGSHVEREVAEQERQEREAQEQQDAELAMTLGYQSQEDLSAGASSAEFSSQILDSSQESLQWLRAPPSHTVSNNSSNHYNRPTQSGLAYLTQAPLASQETATSSVLARRRLGGSASVAPSQQPLLASEDSPSRRIQQLSLQSPPSNKSHPLFSASSDVMPPVTRKLPVRRGGNKNGDARQHPKPDYVEIDEDHHPDQVLIVIPSQDDSDSGHLEANDSINSSYSQMAFGIQPGQILPVDSDVTTPTQSSYGGGGSNLSSRRTGALKGGDDDDDGGEEVEVEDEHGVEAVEESQGGDEGNENLDRVLASISLEAQVPSDDPTPKTTTVTTASKAKRLELDDLELDGDGDDDDDVDDFVLQPAPASMMNRPFRTTKPRHTAAKESTTTTTTTTITAKNQPKARPKRANRRGKTVNLDSTDDESKSTEAAAAPTRAARKKTSVLDSLLPTGVRRRATKGAAATKDDSKGKGKGKAEAPGSILVIASQEEEQGDGDDEEMFLRSGRLGQDSRRGVREKLWNPEDDLSDAEHLDRRQVMGIGVGGIVGGVGAVPGRVTMSRLVRGQADKLSAMDKQSHQQPIDLRPQRSQSQELSTRAHYMDADGEADYGFPSQEWWDHEAQQGGGGGADTSRGARHAIHLDDDDDQRGVDDEDGYMSPLEDFEGLEGEGGGQPFAQFFEEFDATFQAPSSRRRRRTAAAGAGEEASEARASGAAASRGRRGGGWRGRGRGRGNWRGRYSKGSSTGGGGARSRRGRGRASSEGGNVHQMLFGRGVGPILDSRDPLTANFRPSGR